MKNAPLSLLLLLAVSCAQTDSSSTDRSHSRDDGAKKEVHTRSHDHEKDHDKTSSRETNKADNTIRNRKYENREEVTAMEQSENVSDLKITQALRKAIVKDEQLSMDAKNIKIITVNGMMTLKGNVESERELKKIEQTAKKIDGVKKVTNELLIEMDSDNT